MVLRRRLSGQLLVAGPGLEDPNFRRTVVLILEHADEGALGVVLDRPSQTPVGEILEDWVDAVSPPGLIHIGGPVSSGAVVAVARSLSEDQVPGMSTVTGRVGVIDLHQGPEDYLGRLDALRLFAGFASWGEGQIEGELEEEAWWVFDAEPDDPFGPEPAHLWRTVVGRQGGTYRRLASLLPDHLDLN